MCPSPRASEKPRCFLAESSVFPRDLVCPSALLCHHEWDHTTATDKSTREPANRLAAVSLSGLCRAVPGGDERDTRALCGPSGACGLWAGDPFRFVRGTAGVYRAGIGDGACSASHEIQKRRG